jgi:hypothetical protein
MIETELAGVQHQVSFPDPPRGHVVAAAYLPDATQLDSGVRSKGVTTSTMLFYRDVPICPPELDHGGVLLACAGWQDSRKVSDSSRDMRVEMHEPWWSL